MKLLVVFAFFAFTSTIGIKVAQTLPSTDLAPVGGQNVSISGYPFATSSFSFGGLIFMTMGQFSGETTTTLMAFTNDTFQFVQKEILEDFQCFNPEYCLSSYDTTSFFLLCSSNYTNTNAYPVVFVVRPIEGLFFRIVTYQYFPSLTSGNWTWVVSNVPYIWDYDTNAISYIRQSGPTLYSYSLTYDFTTWATDLQDFTWTNMTIVPSYLSAYATLILTGHMQGVQVLALISSNGVYKIVSGGFRGVELLNGDSIMGYTISSSPSYETILTLWDFAKLTSSKPSLIATLNFENAVDIISTPWAEGSNDYFFVSQQSANTLNITQIKWSTGGLSSQAYYLGYDNPVGFAADLENFYIFNAGYVSRYPY